MLNRRRLTRGEGPERDRKEKSVGVPGERRDPVAEGRRIDQWSCRLNAGSLTAIPSAIHLPGNHPPPPPICRLKGVTEPKSIPPPLAGRPRERKRSRRCRDRLSGSSSDLPALRGPGRLTNTFGYLLKIKSDLNTRIPMRGCGKKLSKRIFHLRRTVRLPSRPRRFPSPFPPQLSPAFGFRRSKSHLNRSSPTRCRRVSEAVCRRRARPRQLASEASICAATLSNDLMRAREFPRRRAKAAGDVFSRDGRLPARRADRRV